MWEENSYFLHRKHQKKVADNATCLKALSSSAHTLPFKHSASFLQGNVITISNPFHQHTQWKPAFSTTTRSTGDVTLTNISIFQNSLCERPSKQLPCLAPGKTKWSSPHHLAVHTRWMKSSCSLTEQSTVDLPGPVVLWWVLSKHHISSQISDHLCSKRGMTCTLNKRY